ncbi:hypothetical protein N7478_001577 [Penicillium angulare]|uniref:uncharacterized protein n=1 Tax=Penicillium angulare TaxID=116970 RepID=UPI00253F8D69|nr:uncharacterized protein N7478_001577 [Penicillium angulare]KAJ5288547.1 hypothetical protein N7478_001577 [Penicillium angulare]
MDTANLSTLLEQLDDHVDDLEEALDPCLGQPLSRKSKHLPLMDNAKLHVLITYTLESLIFSYLRLHGVEAKQHPVFRELTRVKQYFQKIKSLETEPEQRTMTLDKGAAGRFIKHGLAGNDKYDLERAEREAKEKARATFKAAMIAKKMTAQSQSSLASNDDTQGTEDAAAQSPANSSHDHVDTMDSDASPSSSDRAKQAKHNKRDHKAKAKSKKSRKLNKAERNDEKKERRQKKEMARKAHMAT